MSSTGTDKIISATEKHHDRNKQGCLEAAWVREGFSEETMWRNI